MHVLPEDAMHGNALKESVVFGATTCTDDIDKNGIQNPPPMLIDHPSDKPLYGGGDKMGALPEGYLGVDAFFDGLADQPAVNPMQLFDESLMTLSNSMGCNATLDNPNLLFSSLPDLACMDANNHNGINNNVGKLDPILAEASIPLKIDPKSMGGAVRRGSKKRRASAPDPLMSSALYTTTSQFGMCGKRKAPGSPRGRPRSIYKPGEKPQPPNIYNVITSPTMALKRSPLSTTNSPAMSAQSMEASPQVANPPFYAAQAPWGVPAPLIPAGLAPPGFWGYSPYHPAYLAALNPLGGKHFSHAMPKVPVQPLNVNYAPLGPVAFAKSRVSKEQRRSSLDGDMTSPTSSLDSNATSMDTSEMQERMQRDLVTRQQFLQATRNLDRDTVTVLEMKQLLRRFSLPCNGRKNDLVERIETVRRGLLQSAPASSQFDILNI